MTLDRSTYIGSSDAARIAGLSPWGSPLSVWMEKTGFIEPKDETLRMWLGSKLEPILLELFEQKTGKSPARYPQDAPPILHPKYPFIGCHPDADYLELKTTEFARDWGEDGSVVTLDAMTIPLHYFIQTQHIMACMEWPTIDVAVLIGHKDFRRYEVPANPTVIDQLIRTEVAFWTDHVETGVAPEQDDIESRKAYLRKRFPAPIADMRAATPEDLQALEEWRLAKAELKSAEQRAEQAANRIKSRIGDNAGIIGEATWTTTRRKGLDMTALREQMTAAGMGFILDACSTETEYRTLRDKGGKR